jgi:UDP-N-acetylmuramoyl-L-alanyl-D-glutamate--2,6-diaminopimelate ligase
MKKIIPQSIKNIYHLMQAILANIIYVFPSKNIKIIGVTGTDGKTTTVHMIAGILEEAGKEVSVASTINFRMKGEESVNETKFTTLSSFQVQKFIKAAVDKGCEYLVLETSSHSLDQYRVWGIKYDTAVITNVTREHLDYHETMEEYRKAKRKLFDNVRVAIVNLDMENPEEYLNCGAKNVYGYTTRVQSSKFKIKSDSSKFKVIAAGNIELGANYSKYQIQNTKYEIQLPGLFNIENALAATCVGLSQNINLEIIKNALEKIKGIPGRLELIPNNKGFNIIVDFALTPNALKRLYELIKTIRESSSDINNNSRVIAIFGACGERDRGKRPITGKIVSEYADYIILTDDEPYHEDPKKIIEEIAVGIENKTLGENFWKIPDRREAIKKALLLAKPGDFVVVTGMGSENTRGIGDQKISWNDKEVILEELNKL